MGATAKARGTGAAARAAPRTYQLHIVLARAQRVRVGRLGTFDFPAGRYVYTGSATRGIEARVRRHLGKTKRLHWHIDYLLAAPGAHIVDVHLSTKTECSVNQHTRGTIIVPGFGSSDCTAGCSSHLHLIAPTPAPRRRRLASTT